MNQCVQSKIEEEGRKEGGRENKISSNLQKNISK